jgi:uncharacterized linocin/CFP29 family protein
MDPKAITDLFANGAAHGDVARRLMAGGMNVNVLRSWIGKDGKPYINVGGQATPTVNATLQYDEWKELDTRVARAARSRIPGVQAMISRGLEYRLGNGLASTVLQSQNASDITAAELSMAGDKQGEKDRVNFETVYLPLPIAHKDFQLSIRVLEASRKNGDGLDLIMAELAARRVAELIEDLFFNGTGSYTFGGGTIYGLTSHPNRNTIAIGTSWLTETGENITGDVLSMRDASHADNHHGPWLLFVPTNFEKAMDSDFKANSDLTVRERIKLIQGVEDVIVADSLTASNVVLCELQPETARIVTGLDITTVEWDTKGGMLFDFKVMSIMVPQIRADQDGKSGIVHLS